MKVLVLNSGSSSVKFQLMRMEDESLLAKGIVEKMVERPIITYQPEGKNKLREIREVPNHTIAIENGPDPPPAPQHGSSRTSPEDRRHRPPVVHGGEDFSASV